MSLELVRSNEQFEAQAQDPFVQRMVNVNGVPFDEEFLGKLVANHFSALPIDRQVIVVENTDPPEAIKELNQVEMFSKNPNSGRYGLFPIANARL